MAEAKDFFPVYKVEHGCILSVRGDITLAYRVELPEIFTLSERDYEAFHQGWVRALKVLPAGTVFHKQDWFLESSYGADFAGEHSVLSRASERFFNERPFLEQECYVFLTRRASGSRLSSSAMSGLCRRSIVPRQTVDPLALEGFLEVAGQLVRIMEDTGFVRFFRLGDGELAGTGNGAGLIERYCFLTGRDALPMVSDVEFSPEFKVGGNSCQLYALSDPEDLPALCGSRIDYGRYSTDQSRFSIGFASPLGALLDCSHILNQYVFIGDTGAVIKGLESKKLRLQSLSAYSRENAASRDAVNDFLNEAVVSQRQPVKAHVNVLVWSRDGSKNSELKNLAGSAFAGLDASAKLETAGHAQLWWAGLPGNQADFPMNDSFDTFLEQASCFFNLETGYRSSLSPVGLRLGDRMTGKPVHVDLSDEPYNLGWISNRAKLLIGPSGSGKSFFLNHMLRSYFEQGAHCVLVDIGHSYRGLCELAGGYYFTYSEASPISFNPFYLSGDEEMDTEKIESIKALILALWKKDDEPYTRAEYVAVSGALRLYFVHLQEFPDIFPCFNTFYDFVSQQYLSVLKEGQVKEKDFDVQNFLFVLNPYYRGGEFSYLLNARENLDMLHQPFIVFELDNVKDHPILFTVVTMVIMEMVISKMRKLKGVRKIVLIEECWKAIAKAGMAEYIRYLFKTMRKFFGEPIVVTQEVDDVISSPIVRQAIVNNADCKILLDQRKYQNRFDQLQEVLGLSDKEKAQVLSLNRANDPKLKYKEVFVSLGGHSKVYRTEVSLEEYLAYSTEEREKVKVQEYARRYGGMARGIAVLASEIRAGRAKL